MTEREKSGIEPAVDSLIGKTREEISELIGAFGQPAYRASQIFKWIHHFNVDSFDEMTNLTKDFRKILADNFQIKTLSVKTHQISTDGTRKFLWRLSDGREVESVMMPEAKRTTICISSQVGCALGCKFCATGKMGFLRNLTPGEIIEQVLLIKKITGMDITNLVFMGMGEPFLNYSRAMQAGRIFSDPEGLAISARRITYSTSGVIPQIYKFADDPMKFKLAISLHAPNQQLRRKIMPLALKFPMDGLMESMHYYMKADKQNRVTFEYVLLAGINDSIDDMKQLISLLSPIRCKLNLIPCNQNNLGYDSPGDDHVDELRQFMEQASFPVTVRKNRGEDITAACGQLAANTQEKVIFMKDGD